MADQQNKLIALDESLTRIAQARQIVLGGWSMSRKPCGMIRHIIAAGLRLPEVVILTAGVETDMLLAAGAVDRVRTFYFGLEAFGMGPGQRRGADMIEETESSLLFGLQAAAQGQPFHAVARHHCRALLMLRTDLETITCPYGGDEYVALPPITPDLAIIHAWRCDRRGNAEFGGTLAADRLLAAAARETIVTCEELVDDLAAIGGQADLIAPQTSAVVHLPNGAWPTGCEPRYRPDWKGLRDYAQLDPDAVPAWLDRHPLPTKG